LEEVLTTRNAAQQHGRTATLTATQRAELVAFLKELAPEDAPTLAEVAPGQAPPTFTAGPAEILLPRELPPGTVLGTYAASDPDPGQKVHFRLLGPDAAYTSIDNTGSLRWAGRLPMRSPFYRVTIVAEDDGRLPAATSRVVTLRLPPPPPPSISLAKKHTPERPLIRIAWIHQPGIRRYRLESAPAAAGPFREFGNRRFEYQDLGREVEHIAELKHLRNGTWVRVVGEGLDDAGARLDTPSEALAVPY
jgi:hypothetical protein